MKEVTLKFYSVDEKLPKKSGKYLTIDIDDIFFSLFIWEYSKKHKKFNAGDEEIKPKYAIDKVKYWAEIPDLKKILKKENGLLI